MNERKQHLLNVVVSQLNTGLVTAGSFVVTPAVLYGLGDSRYGGWLIANSFISYMRMLDLGTSAGTVKYGAGAEHRSDPLDLQRVLDTSAAIFAGLAAIALVVTFVLGAALPRVYPVLAGQTPTILLLGGAMVVDLAFRSFGASLRMRSMHYIHDGVEIGTYAVFKLGLVVYFAYRRELTYEVLALLTMGEVVIRTLIVSAASWFVLPAARHINPLRAHRAMVMKLATMGAAVSIMMVADIVRFQVDAGVIGAFLPSQPEQISIFGIGTRLVSIAAAVVGSIATVLVPRFSGLAETNDQAGLLALLRRTTSQQGVATSLILVGLAVLGPNFLALWLGKPWIGESGTILLVMVPGYYLSLLSGPASALLMGRGKLRGLMILTVVEAAINLGLSMALIGPFGIYGVALGTVIPLAVFRGVVFPLLVQREIGLSIVDYWKMHARTLVLTGSFFALTIGFAWIPLTSYLRFVELVAASVAIFVVLVALCFPDARQWMRRRIRRRA